MRPLGKGRVVLSWKRISSALHSLRNTETKKNYPTVKGRKIKDLDNRTKACGLPERLDSL